MSEQEKEQLGSEDENEVEAHRRHPGMSEDQNASDDESSDDFEAHRRLSE